MKSFASLDQRYYHRKMKQRETLGLKLKELVAEMKLKKHIRVRKQIVEGKKIRDIEQALINSKALISVECDSQDFEMATEREITDVLNKEQRMLREVELQKIAVELNRGLAATLDGRS